MDCFKVKGDSGGWVLTGFRFAVKYGLRGLSAVGLHMDANSFGDGGRTSTDTSV